MFETVLENHINFTIKSDFQNYDGKDTNNVNNDLKENYKNTHILEPFQDGSGNINIVIKDLNKGVYLNLSGVEAYDKYNNLIPPKKATMSSLYSTKYTAENCIDGDINTFCHTSAGDDQPSLTIEYEGNVEIHKIKVYNRQNCCKDRIVDGSIFIMNSSKEQMWGSKFSKQEDEYIFDVVLDHQKGYMTVFGAFSGVYDHISDTSSVWKGHIINDYNDENGEPTPEAAFAYCDNHEDRDFKFILKPRKFLRVIKLVSGDKAIIKEDIDNDTSYISDANGKYPKVLRINSGFYFSDNILQNHPKTLNTLFSLIDQSDYEKEERNKNVLKVTKEPGGYMDSFREGDKTIFRGPLVGTRFIKMPEGQVFPAYRWLDNKPKWIQIDKEGNMLLDKDGNPSSWWFYRMFGGSQGKRWALAYKIYHIPDAYWGEWGNDSDHPSLTGYYPFHHGLKDNAQGILPAPEFKLIKHIPSRDFLLSGANIEDEIIDGKKCNWKCYYYRYPDLQNHYNNKVPQKSKDKFGNDPFKWAANHYKTSGQIENRNPECDPVGLQSLNRRDRDGGKFDTFVDVIMI